MKPNPRSSFILFCAVGLLVGCESASVNKTTPKSTGLNAIPANEVKVYPVGKLPTEKFDVIAPISLWAIDSKHFEARMKAEAGGMGANALIGVYAGWRADNIGPLQSGIAARLLAEGQTPRHLEMKSAVAIVPIMEMDIDAEKAARIRNGIEAVAARHLHERGYVPVFVTTPLPSGSNAAAQVNFDLLRGTEAAFCEKMLVMKFERGFEQRDVYVAAWNHGVLTGELRSKSGQVLWKGSKTRTEYGGGPTAGVFLKDPWNMAVQLTAKVLDPLPTNPEKF